MTEALSEDVPRAVRAATRHARRERALLRRPDAEGARARALRAAVEADPGSVACWGLFAGYVQACLYGALAPRRRQPAPAREKPALLDPLVLGQSALTPAGLWAGAEAPVDDAPGEIRDPEE